jgi:hypothetical protein
MGRLHLFEIHDQPWCPASLRDALTDNLQFFLTLGNHYAPLVPRLRRALARTGANRVVDLCSGAGGPWRRLADATDVDVLLTDRFPNPDAWKRIQTITAGRVRGHAHPVDATAVPPELRGFLTLFTALHHFRPDEARAILRDAVRRRQGIAVGEMTSRRLAAFLATLAIPLLVWLAAPFIRPFRWSRLVWTYLLPVAPFMIAFDGFVSCLRTYDPAELQALTRDLNGAAGKDGYAWESGELPGRFGGGAAPITYLIGIPPRT